MARDGMIFYKSFRDALKNLPEETRLECYDAIFSYGLDGEEPELTGVSAAIFALVKPQIDANNKRRDNGTKGGRPEIKPEPHDNQTETETEPNDNQTETKPEPKEKEKVKDKVKDKGKVKDKEKVNVKENAKEEDKYILLNIPHMVGEPTDFERFWREYPKKVGKQDAKRAFTRAKKSVDADTMIRAVIAQKKSLQWTRDNGRYIPNPATWLNQGRWDDEIQTKGNTSFGIDWDNV